jgi:hypothetical protein
MKSFHQFISEAKEIDDREGLGSGTGMTHRGGEKIGTDRKKTEAEKKRTKAVGGGKTVPAKPYKKRSDVGTQRQTSTRVQQPTRERGSASLTPREQQRKAAKERRAAKSSGSNKKDLEKAASKLLTKKTTKSVNPNYKAAKASGYTRPERRKLQRAGDRLLKDIAKKKEQPAAHYNPKL